MQKNFVFSLACERFSNESWIYLARVFMQEASGGEELLKYETCLPGSEMFGCWPGVQCCRKAENQLGALRYA